MPAAVFPEDRKAQLTSEGSRKYFGEEVENTVRNGFHCNGCNGYHIFVSSAGQREFLQYIMPSQQHHNSSFDIIINISPSRLASHPQFQEHDASARIAGCSRDCTNRS